MRWFLAGGEPESPLRGTSSQRCRQVLETFRVNRHAPPTDLFWPLAPLYRTGKDGVFLPMKAFVCALLIPGLVPLTAGAGSPRETLETGITRENPSTEPEGYVVDPVGLPQEPLGGTPVDVRGFDFLRDGRLVIATSGGDVWVAMHSDLKTLQWHRCATGLRRVTGLKVIEGAVHVGCSEGLAVFREVDGSNAAKALNPRKDVVPAIGWLKAGLSDLHSDEQGNLYCVSAKGPGHKGKGAGQGSAEGGIFRLRADGSGWDVFTTGGHVPTGLGLGPSGALTYSNRNGIWAPGVKLQWTVLVNPNPTHAPGPNTVALGDGLLCWIPSEWRHSKGGQVAVTSQSWGPWKDQLLQLSDGKSPLLGVLREEVRGRAQGAILAFRIPFPGGIKQGRFNPVDGQLYVSGRSVSASGVPEGGWLQRVRYSGAPVRMPVEWRAQNKGFTLRFGCDLDTQSAADPGNYELEVWEEPPLGLSQDVARPHRQTIPGSAKSVARVGGAEKPPKSGRKIVSVESAGIGTDDKTVFLEVPGLRPPLRMRVRYRVKSVDGVQLKGELFATVHLLGAAD
jgi:hypothetical protein